MRKLSHRSSEGIKAHVAALNMAKRNLYDKKLKGIESVKRISRSLKRVTINSGDPEVHAALAQIEGADRSDVGSYLDILLPRLGKITTAIPAEIKTVLMVEDDPIVVHLLEKQLDSKYRHLVVAKTIKEAEAILTQRHISLLVLDLQLPDGDGRDLLLHARNNPITADIPIIVVSSNIKNDIKTECFALGADSYFEKPFDPITLATAIAAKLQRFADITRRSSIDPVTRLPNRMTFYRAFAQAARLASRTKEPLTMAILDLDRFKSVNDTSGHQMGDRVLRTFSSLLLRTLRTSDVVARWGGEEFAVLFPNTDLTQARIALNKSLEALRKETFKGPDKRPFRITFSAGVTQVSSRGTIEKAIAEADRYLYLAKSSGRNHVLSKEDSLDSLKRNILLVEDDDFMAALLRRYLEKAGFRVFHAKDAKIALSLCSEAVFSLITLDVKLPDMDGFELLKQFRQSPTVRHVPVIMLTATNTEENVIKGFNLGADDYIVKPFSPSQLLARANRLLEK